MAIITSIKPQKKKEARFNIFLDGKFACSLPVEVVVREKLKEDQEISSEKVTALIKESDFSLVFDKVLKFLSFRPRSEFEIEEYMLRKNVGEETRKMVLQKLKQLQLVDDEAFAKWWIEQRSTFRPEGSRLLKFELKRKGVSAEIVARLLSEERPGIADFLLAEKLVRKKYERLKNLPPLEIKKKIYASLSPKGFSFEVIEKAVAKVLKKE